MELVDDNALRVVTLVTCVLCSLWTWIIHGWRPHVLLVCAGLTAPTYCFLVVAYDLVQWFYTFALLVMVGLCVYFVCDCVASIGEW